MTPFGILIIIGIVTLWAIALSVYLEGKFGFASPLILLLTGMILGLAPIIPNFQVNPQIIIDGVLPPLLFSAASAMPIMDIRRNLGPIVTLSVVLVVVSALVLGWFFHLLIPGMSLAAGIALGAIVSPTDAVATTIVKSQGVSHRLVTVLQGEGLMNDASALVLLATAIAATNGTTGQKTDLPQMVADMGWAVIGALLIGWAVGELMIRVRGLNRDPAADTVISMTVPFIAYIIAQQLNASGLVAVVMAGLVTGHHGVSYIAPSCRLTSKNAWMVLSQILEGTVFLLMGAQLGAFMEELRRDSLTLTQAFWTAIATILVLMLVRVLIVAPTIKNSYRKTSPQRQRMLERVSAEAPEHPKLQTHLEKIRADFQYFIESKFTFRDGVLISWVGLRGVVTLAAAQTLPFDFPHRAFVVVTAFLVSTMSLVLQGGTLPVAISLIKPSLEKMPSREERRILHRRLTGVIANTPIPEAIENALSEGQPRKIVNRSVDADMAVARICDRLREAELDAVQRQELINQALEYGIQITQRKRRELIRMRHEGTWDSRLLDEELHRLDASQISLQVRFDVRSRT